MFYQLPPVGNRIHISGGVSTELLLKSVFSSYTPRYFASGTAALSAAIIAAVKLKGLDAPEVILPAYGCPDLVSAAIFAGAKPVLVDFEPDRPWIDLERLSYSIGANTVAIVAVNLFGIPERLHALKEISRQASVLLIEDSAQAFPDAGDQTFWSGDLVVVSFGRGKPVSLLGGGAVLFKKEVLGNLLPEPTRQANSAWTQRIAFWMSVNVYNLMLSPYGYWIPQALPFLHLGETRFHPLNDLAMMDPVRLRLLPTNINAYQERDKRVQSAISEVIAALCDDGKGLIDLPAACQMQPSQRLLRYPLLLERERRDSVYHCMCSRGLGASKMYPGSLPDVPGLEFLAQQKDSCPAADDFAARILTLPVHEGVTDSDLGKIASCLVT